MTKKNSQKNKTVLKSQWNTLYTFTCSFNQKLLGVQRNSDLWPIHQIWREALHPSQHRGVISSCITWKELNVKKFFWFSSFLKLFLIPPSIYFSCLLSLVFLVHVIDFTTPFHISSLSNHVQEWGNAALTLGSPTEMLLFELYPAALVEAEVHKSLSGLQMHGTSQCCGLNVCVSPKLAYWDPNAQCDGVGKWGLWRWLYHEDIALVSGIRALVRGPRMFPCPFCHLDTVRSLQAATLKKTFTSIGPRWHPDLGPPASRTVRNKVLLFISHMSLLWSLVIVAWMDEDSRVIVKWWAQLEILFF